MKQEEHCHGVHICLVGANRFQNEMFVTALKQIHQCQNEFIVASAFSEIPEAIFHKEDDKVLFYLDCFGLDGRQLERLLSSACHIVQSKYPLALFNLTKDSGIEIEALNYGVRGFFYTNDAPADFCKGTRGVLSGEVWLSRKIASEVILAGTHPPSHHSYAEAEAARLSTREKEVLTHLSSGATNKVIAAELFVSIHTLRTHLYHIYRKINVHNRTQAVRWAEKNL